MFLIGGPGQEKFSPWWAEAFRNSNLPYLICRSSRIVPFISRSSRIIIVSLLSYEGPRLQNLGHLYRKTHNKKTKTNQNCTLLKIKNIV